MNKSDIKKLEQWKNRLLSDQNSINNYLDKRLKQDYTTNELNNYLNQLTFKEGEITVLEILIDDYKRKIK